MKFSDRFNIFKTGKKFEGIFESDNPFFKEGLRDYCKYNSIQIVNAEDELGGVITRFKWNGETMVSVRTEGIEFKDKSNLTLSGITGKMEVKLT